MITQVELARTLGLDVSTVNKILNRRPGMRFRKETVRQVFQTAKSMGFDFNRIKHPQPFWNYLFPDAIARNHRDPILAHELLKS